MKKSLVKTARIIVKCRPELRDRWRKFVAGQGFEDYEAALEWLLNIVERAETV